MAFTVGQVQAKVGADDRPFNSTMDKVKKRGARAARSVSDSFSRIGKRMQGIGTSMTAAITAPLVGAGGLALKTAADYEQLQIQLNTLVGSAEKGTQIFKDLKEFSAKTPFQVKDITKANNTLIGMGQSAEDAFDMVQMLGDVSAATGANISELAVTIGQASAEGRLMTRDIRELVNRGVPATKLLADSMGVAKGEIFDLASQGKISFKVLQKALQDATQEGGIYAGATEKAVNTLKGAYSTLKDNATFALAEIGKSLNETFDIQGLMQGLTKQIQKGIDWFNSLSDSTKKMAFTIVGLLGASGPAILALGTLSAAIGAISLPITGVIAAVGGLAAAFVYVADNWEATKERLGSITWWRNAIIDMVQIFLDYNPISLIIEGFNSLLSYFGSATIPNPFTGLSGSLEGLKADTVDYKHEFGSFTDAVVNGISRITGMDFSFGGSAGADSGADNFKKTRIEAARLGNTISNITTPSLQNMKANIPNAIDGLSATQVALGKTTEQAKVLGTQLQTTLTNAVSTFATTLGNAFTGDAGAKGFFNNIITIVADFANQFGKLLIGAGTAALAFKSLLANPIAAIAAGAALIAASTAVKNLVKAGPSQESVNDALITSSGKVVKFSNNDDLLAMKDMGSLGERMGGGKSMSPRQMKNAFKQALQEAVTEVSPSRVFELNEQGRIGA